MREARTHADAVVMSSGGRKRKLSSPSPEGPSPAKRNAQLGKWVFALFHSHLSMSEVVFSGRPYNVANVATRIPVNGLTGLFARDKRFPVFIRTQIQIMANVSYCIK